MLRKLFGALIAIPGMVVKLANWLINPKNGADYVTPFNRRFLSTGASFAVTVLYRTGSGLYNFITSYVLGSIAYVLQVLAGIALDLWRANPSYSRWVLGMLISGVMFLATGAMFVAKVGYAGLVSLIGRMR